MNSKEKTFHLAIDIGASGGRHILGYLENDRLITEEVFRFGNGIRPSGGRLIWDVDELFGKILEGMKKCSELGMIPRTVGIDTWGVDFVLLDRQGKRIGDAVSYRDHRTEGMDKIVEGIIPAEELYSRTGIQKQIFNTIYQLTALRVHGKETLDKAGTLLLLPDYFNYLLTGRMAAEYTNATTTGLVDARSGMWDKELIRMLGFPEDIFIDITMPGNSLGVVKPGIADRIGYEPEVFMTASHDTASAILAVPGEASGKTVYISSGTWSLMGTELSAPNLSGEGRKCNFTNEGGYGQRYRYLKNIMGLWMIQSVRCEMAPDMPYEQISVLASESTIDSIVDVNDPRFLSPESMVSEIISCCRETGQRPPGSLAEAACIVYRSLAAGYADTLEEIEKLTGEKYDTINIVGGGSNAEFLNALTAEKTRRRVVAGPGECTAAGNLLAVMIAEKEIKDPDSAREIIRRSFEVKEYAYGS
ncbi:MAG: rhamnulokinase [Lachnospiraceae bacterium]|nr:rhamnulokinase [Lachnospiraceae bacterium]